MTACQPFTTKLISSNLPMFRYCWIWQKNTVTGHLQANIRPLNNYEDIAVFAHAAPRYFPQGVQYVSKVSRGGSSNVFRATKEIYTSRGTGSCGVPVRFFCPPEITLHTLRSKADD